MTIHRTLVCSVTSAIVATVVFLTPHEALAQRGFDSVQIEATHVAGHVHMLTGRGGNIGVSVGKDGLLIVDDQFAPLAEKIDAALRSIDKGELKFVLNTHWHGDHTGGNEHFGKKATIIAHSNVRKRLAERGTNPTPEAALPVITFDDSLSLHFNGEEVKVIHVPAGHTDGDSIILFTESNVVHMGDQFFSGRFPYIDLSSGGDVKGYIRNVKMFLDKLPDGAKIIPGHGPLSTRKELEEFHEMLVDTTTTIREAIEAGKTIQEIKEQGLNKRWQSWGEGFINTSRWIDIVHNSFTQ